jgi:serine/threonine-protein kinase PknG
VETGSPPPATDEPGPADTTVPEERRFCKGCKRPVGRGYQGRPGRVTGFCPECQRPFNFTHALAGKLIADRYRVLRRLGGGGFGDALLAHSLNLDTEVVLKDLSQSVAETAEEERNALVALRHDSIVRIYGYEPEGPYLVLEYVRGTPLSVRADDRLEVILAHGLQILQALDYLHARGLLHIDVKPANVIRFPEESADGPRDRVRLIDFGAVWKLGKPGPVDSYTPLYAPPKSDREHRAPTVGFDLFCLGRTLQELCAAHVRGQSVLAGGPALDRLLERATDARTPGRRFVSARQFAEQLSGVIRQVVAMPAPGHGEASGDGQAPPRGARLVSRPSAVFGSMTEPLHGGLGESRPLDHWIQATMPGRQGITLDSAPFAAPTPSDAVTALPTPLADPDDPAHTRGCEVQLAQCRAALRDHDPDRAAGILYGTNLPDWSWILAWYSGLIALARGEALAAADYFGTVHNALAGELIPLLALGICTELGERQTEARQRYRTVADTAPALAAAGYGLARACLLDGQRAAAVTAAERLAGELHSRELRSENEARIAVVRLLASVTGSSLPDVKDLDRAERLTERLPVTAAERTRLHTEILYGRATISGDWLALSEAMPALARQAGTKADFFAMIDRANRLRPPVESWWKPGFRRTRDTSAV